MTITRQSRRSELINEFDQFLRSIYNDQLSEQYKSVEEFIDAMNQKLTDIVKYDNMNHLFGDDRLGDKNNRPISTNMKSPYFDPIFPLVISLENLSSEINEKINEKLRSYNEELATLPNMISEDIAELSENVLLENLSKNIDIASAQHA